MADDLIKKSGEILQRAILDYDPYAIVCMFSGGNDSRLEIKWHFSLPTLCQHVTVVIYK